MSQPLIENDHNKQLERNDENNFLNHQNMFIIKLYNTYNTIMNDIHFMTIRFWGAQNKNDK